MALTVLNTEQSFKNLESSKFNSHSVTTKHSSEHNFSYSNKESGLYAS